jgi:four helix bundle protein
METQVRSFRDLRVRQAGVDLVEQVYRLTRPFPRHEVYRLAGQMQRAAVSIPSNIAEGHTREHSREYFHHVSMAQASLAELETQLEIAVRLGYLSLGELNEALAAVRSLGKQLYALRNALTDKAGPRPLAPDPLDEVSQCK